MVVHVHQPGLRQHPVASSDELHTLVKRLRKPEYFPHPVQQFQIIETHISYILLTGEYAYKFKKPVNLGFLDFSNPERRYFYCEEELRLNQPLAPELYLGLVKVTGDLHHPELDGEGPLLEYAVKMRQFDENLRLDHVTERGELRDMHIDALADQLATFHMQAPAAPLDCSYGEAAEVRRPVLENFSQISSLLTDPEGRDTLDEIRRWTEQSLLVLQGDFQQRRHNGWIRECHGDLHLGNIALFHDRITLFDRLEFSESLRWIDVMNDVAFLVMDLGQRGYQNLAMRLMNRYLEHTGDYLGLASLRFYIVYRAMVRAKVAIIQAHQRQEQQQDHRQLDEVFTHYLQTARRFTDPPEMTPLIITHGLSGSGKTWLSKRLSESITALRVRSDVERKRMFNLNHSDKVPNAVGQGIYRPDITQETYRRLQAIAYMILDAGCPAILDATFLNREHRDLMHKLARTIGVPFIILDVRAPDELLRERIHTRKSADSEASDAGIEVLDHQLSQHDALGEDEQPYVVVAENVQGLNMKKLTERVRDKAREQIG